MRFALYLTLLICLLPLVFSRPFFGLCVYYVVSFMQPKVLCWRPDLQDSLLVGVPLVAGAILFGVRQPRWAPAAPSGGGALSQGLREQWLRGGLFEPSWQALLLLLLVGYIGLTGAVSTLHAPDAGEMYGRLCKVVLVTVLMTGLAASADRFHALCIVVAVATGFWAIKAGAWTLLLGPHRTHGEDYDNNLFALKSVMVLPLLYQLGMADTNRRRRYLFMGLAALTALGIIGSRSRSGFVALAFVLICMMWSGRHRIRAALGVCLLGFVALIVSGNEIRTRLTSIEDYQSDRSAGKRFVIWQAAWDVFAAHPLTGVGFARFEAAHQKENQRSWAAHNIWLQNLAELGLIGHPLWLALVLGTILELYLLMRRTARAPPELRRLHHAASGLLMGMCAFWIHGMFHNEEYLELMFTFIGMTVCLRVVVRHEWTRAAAAAQQIAAARSRPTVGGVAATSAAAGAAPRNPGWIEAVVATWPGPAIAGRTA